MKPFLIKTSIFILLLFLFFGVNMLVNYFIYNKQSIPFNKHNVLIVGDSHPQRSLNPEYFNDAQNISQSAEPYVLTYWKLKRICDSYIPDTLIVGFAPHNISQFNDLKFSNAKWSEEMFRRSYPIQEFNKISNKINIDYTLFYKTLWKQTAFFPKRNHTNFIGNYSNTNKSNIKDWETAIKRHYYQNGEHLGVSGLSVIYLDSIINLANAKKIKLIMVSNPVHERYLEKIPIPIMGKYAELAKNYSMNHIVFNRTMNKYPDSLYLNSDHLNGIGAKRFTEELNDYIKMEARTHNDVCKK
jgi:hypothetical protein